jgi:hypothetical protein
MQAIRVIQEVAPDGCLHVRVPSGMGKKFELIIVPLDEPEDDAALQYMKMQEESGFALNVLAAVEEDVWNEI